MQIKFNKVKPASKGEEQKPTAVQHGTGQNHQKPTPPPHTQSPTPKMEELPKPPHAEKANKAPMTPPSKSAVSAAAESAFAAVAPHEKAEAVAPAQPETMKPPIPAEPKPKGERLEDTLKKYLNKQVRIYMADHESVTGRLDIVEDGWVKVCNARSAGSDYYFDEEIINTVNIVRIHTSHGVEKEKYVEYMNELNK